MKLRKIFQACAPILIVLTFFTYIYLSDRGAFSGRLDVSLALKKSDTGWLYLDEPLDLTGDPFSASTNQYGYYAYPQKGSTDVIVTDQAHQVVAAIVFEDINKGKLGITITEERANIHLRNGRVAILSGGNVVEVLSHQEANSNGIHYRPETVVASPWEAALLIALIFLFIFLFLRAFILSYKDDR